MTFNHTGTTTIRNWLRSSPLGSGSFGHVSLALNVDDGSLFAVKTVPCSSPQQLLAIQNELRILKTLNSPSIIRFFGAEFRAAHQGSPASLNLFLEYMEGGSLASVVTRYGGKLDERRARLYTRSILQGLDYLHQNGIVHCDIKGQNILIGSSGVCKIADFGAAKRVDDGKSKFAGTPLWMAPEVIHGQEQGCPSDIWSLGCTVVELLTGRPPWGHLTNTASALYRIAFSDESSLLPDSISADAKDFLLHCLKRDPQARWTAAELLNHPFVCAASCENGNDSVVCGDQPSPRSILTFVGDEKENDSDMGSDIPIFMSSCAVAASQQQVIQDTRRKDVVTLTASAAVPEKIGEWVTVKRMDGWSRERQVCFMASEGRAAEGGSMQVRKGGEPVSLDAALFLRKRKTVG